MQIIQQQEQSGLQSLIRDQNGSFFGGSFFKGREGNTQFTWHDIKSNLAVCEYNYNNVITITLTNCLS